MSALTGTTLAELHHNKQASLLFGVPMIQLASAQNLIQRCGTFPTQRYAGNSFCSGLSVDTTAVDLGGRSSAYVRWIFPNQTAGPKATN